MKLKLITGSLFIGSLMISSAQNEAGIKDRQDIRTDNRGSVTTPAPAPGTSTAPVNPDRTTATNADNRGTVDTPSPAGNAGAEGGAPTEMPQQTREASETGAGEARETHFEGSNPQQVQLSEVDEKVRSGLQRAANGADLGDEVTRVQYGDQQVIRANVSGEEGDSVIFVNNEGEVVKTQHKIEASEAPEAVRKIAEQQKEGATETALMREEGLGQVSYILKVERDNQPARWMQIDEAGNVVRTLAEPDRAAAQPGE